MPLHMKDLDVASEVEGLRSALIVPCNMCPAVTVAARERKPFLQLFRSFSKSSPFESYLSALRRKLREQGVRAKVFRSNLYHQWFMCMWTSRRRKKLKNWVSDFEAVIVLGCNSATETVRDVVQHTDCKVIEGMAVAGIMNAKLAFRLPGDLVFQDCRVYPISQQEKSDPVYK